MDKIRLRIYHTNDMHARIEAMSRLSHLVKRRRLEDREQRIKTLFWDAGDAADRSVEICSLTKGAAFYDLLNSMGTELQTSGNDLALTYGPHVLAACARRATFPILAANLRDGPDGDLVEGLAESMVIPIVPGVNLGVFGLTDPWYGAYQDFGLDMPETIPTARRIVQDFLAQDVSPIALLSHLGLENDRLLANQVEGISLIVGSHSHDLLPDGEIVGATMIVQAGEYARFLGCTTLDIDTRTGAVIAAQAEVIEVPEDEPKDPVFEQALERARAEVLKLKSERIGVLPERLETAYSAECRFGNFTVDALRQHMGAEIGILMSGLLSADLPQGEVTMGDLTRACFSTANPYRSTIEGRKIWSALERGLDPAISEKYVKSFRGTPVGIPQISGLKIEYNPDAGLGHKISRIKIKGGDLDVNRKYSVAHTDAEVADGWGYLQLDIEDESYSDAPTILPEVIAAYIRNPDSWLPLDLGRWIVTE